MKIGAVWAALAYLTLLPAAARGMSCAGCSGAFLVWPDATATLPLNPVLILRYCSAEDFKRGNRPYLQGPDGRVSLKQVAVVGLVPPLRAFAPRRLLKPNLRYEFHLTKQDALAREGIKVWMTGDSVDRAPPAWRAQPSVAYAGSSKFLSFEHSDLLLKISVVDDTGPVAVLFQVGPDDRDHVTSLSELQSQYLLKPAGSPEAESKFLSVESGGCSPFYFRFGQVLRVRLALVDVSGHTTPSEKELRFRVPAPRPEPQYETKTVIPQGSTLLSKVEPSWTEFAKKARIQGTVAGTLSIGPDGAVKEVKIVKSISPLDGAVVEALKQWKFAPARDGVTSGEVPFWTHFMVIVPEYHPDWNP
jgi:TonB family protein